MNKFQRAAIYVGGLIGPFTGQSLAVILPDISKTFGISVATAATAVTCYMIPFATMMLVSTRLVRGVRPLRVILTAFTVIALAATVCMLSSNWYVFCAAFMVIGFANAFTTPVLQVMLKQLVPEEELGAALGTFAAMQSLGVFSAPLVADFASLLNWQLVFLLIVVLSLGIVLRRVPDIDPPYAAKAGESKPAVQWTPLVIQMATFLVVGLGLTGLSLVFALDVEQRFGLSAVERGMAVMTGGLLAFIFTRHIGKAADRIGVGIVMLWCGIAAAIAVVLIPLAPNIVLATMSWAASVVAAQGIQTCVTYSVLRTPWGHSLNSTVQGFRFYGMSLTPLVLVPMHHGNPQLAFWLPAASIILTMLMQWTLVYRHELTP